MESLLRDQLFQGIHERDGKVYADGVELDDSFIKESLCYYLRFFLVRIRFVPPISSFFKWNYIPHISSFFITLLLSISIFLLYYSRNLGRYDFWKIYRRGFIAMAAEVSSLHYGREVSLFLKILYMQKYGIYYRGHTWGFQENFPVLWKFRTTREDVMVILGDAGINFHGPVRDHKKRII